MLFTGLLTTLLTAAIITLEPGDLTVFENDYEGVAPDTLVLNSLAGEAEIALEKRRLAVEALNTPEEIRAYQEKLHPLLESLLGLFTDRTPLNPRQVMGGTGDGFRYEKIILESRPGFFVSAILYLPLSQGPYPAVLVPCGHEPEGKGTESYQRASILLARNGIAALCYDPIGQGERFHFFNEDGSHRFSGTIEHTLAGASAILTGTSLASYRIYDGMRCLDYLESRKDIDGSRLGCTGNSGGGTLTSYLMALDPRVQAAAPSCYLTTWERLLETIGPQDAEQNVYGQIALGINHPDFVHLRAPKPTLYCAATQDFFDIQGTWDNFRETKRIYTKLGFPERVDLVEVNESHGFTPRLRATMVHWMRRWLLAQDGHIDEADFTILTPEEFQCTENGLVAELPGARSVFDLNRERMNQFSAQRRDLWTKPQDGLAKISALLRVSSRSVDTALPSKVMSSRNRDGITLTRLVLESTSGVPIPAVLFEPEEVLDCLLYVHEKGKKALVTDVLDLVNWVKEGTAVLAVDYSLAGELDREPKYSGDWLLVGRHWDINFRAYGLGQSLVSIRTRDLLAAINFLESHHQGAPVKIHATGAATVPALHAAALKSEIVDAITLEEGIPSWEAVVNTDGAINQIENTVHGALEWYDLPDIITHLCPDMVTEINPVVPVF